MKIEINQWKPEVIRKFKGRRVVVGPWWENFSGLQLFGMRVLGISLKYGIVISEHPFKYQYDNLSIWIYFLTWPIEIDLRWNKRPSNFNKQNG